MSPPETQDTSASNTGAGTEDAGQAEPLVPPVPRKKKKTPASSPSKTVPDPSAPASSAPAKEAPAASAPTKAPTRPPAAPAGGPASAKPTPPKGTGSSSFGPQPLTLHASRAAIVAGETASAQLGRITDFTRGGELGHLLDYADKWNQADLSPATGSLGKDKLSVIYPSGPRSTIQHFSRLRRAVKEFDTAWHDTNNNVVSTMDARKQLFEELLWEHRELSEAHNKCQAVPEGTVEALSSQVAALQAEKEQLAKEHQRALDVQRTNFSELKEHLMAAESRHSRELKEVRAAAAAKLNESLEEYTNSTAMMRAEREEQTKAREEQSKARETAENRVAALMTEQKDFDRLVIQTDTLLQRLFPDSQVYAYQKVENRRTELSFRDRELPWDAYDHLVALSARVQHMRSVDRHLVDLPDHAKEIYKVLWPEDAVSESVTLISDRLKDACWRIWEWKWSAARAGADAALRVACSWYDDLDLDAFHTRRGDAPTDTDPAKTAKRQDRAYRIAEFAPVHIFIPPPPEVRDALSDDEEDIEEEEEKETGEGDAPPEDGAAPRKLQRPVPSPLLSEYTVCLLFLLA
nr:uncharacterized protein LOC127318764 [Lolium perenne]